jgi:hypothetical protein
MKKVEGKQILFFLILICVVTGLYLYIKAEKEGFTTQNPLFRKFHRTKRHLRRDGIQYLKEVAYDIKKWVRRERIL